MGYEHSSEKIQKALQLHECGQLHEARLIYQEVIQENQVQHFVLNLYGTLLHQQGCHAMAVNTLKKAIALNSDNEVYYNRLGAALSGMEDNNKAIVAYSRSTFIKNDLFESQLNLGSALLTEGRTIEAYIPAKRAVHLDKDSWIARLKLGSIYQSMEKYEQAIQEFNLASEKHPFALEPYFQLCRIYNKIQNSKDGLKTAKKGLILAPERFEFYPQLHGISLIKNEPQEFKVLRWAEQTVIVRVTDSAFWYLLGLEYQRHDFRVKFLKSAMRSVILEPSSSKCYHTLSHAFLLLGKFKPALFISQIVSIIFPGSATNNHLIWESLFAMGEKQAAWSYWEARFNSVGAPKRIGLPEKKWKTGDSGKEKLLVCSEQGIGDEILYLSCLPDLLQDQTAIVVECDSRWKKLFERSFPSIKVVSRQVDYKENNKIFYDYREVVAKNNIKSYVLNGDLPAVYRYSLNEPVRSKGYLKADPGRIKTFKYALNKISKKTLVGICWRSAFSEPIPFIYAKLDELISCLPEGNYCLVSLQYGDFTKDIVRIETELGVKIHEIPDLDQTEDLDGVAALISCLDLVIAPSSSVLHLSCALGVPTISTYYPNFRSDAKTDPLFGNCLPVLKSDEVFYSSVVAERTGLATRHFLEFGELPFRS